MPFSNQDSIPTVMHLATVGNPKRILDVGVGLGIYGLLLRTNLDVAHERLTRDRWQIRIEGLEIFPDYRNPVWDYAYDRIHIGDARTHPFDDGSFDVVLINDVLEHLTRDEAIACLRRFLAIGRVAIVTSPIGDLPQGAWGGNVHETHRSVLSPADLPHVVCTKVTGATFCAVCCRDDETAERYRWAARTAPVARAEWLPYISYRLRRKWRSIARSLGR